MRPHEHRQEDVSCRRSYGIYIIVGVIIVMSAMVLFFYLRFRNTPVDTVAKQQMARQQEQETAQMLSSEPVPSENATIPANMRAVAGVMGEQMAKWMDGWIYLSW